MLSRMLLIFRNLTIFYYLKTYFNAFFSQYDRIYLRESEMSICLNKLNNCIWCRVLIYYGDLLWFRIWNMATFVEKQRLRWEYWKKTHQPPRLVIRLTPPLHPLPLNCLSLCFCLKKYKVTCFVGLHVVLYLDWIHTTETSISITMTF